MSKPSNRGRHKRFPTFPREKNQRGNIQVDVEKVKEMYLSGGHYRWSDFCNSHGFNPSSKDNSWFKESVNWEEWKREWVRQRNIVAEEDITPKMLDCTKLIAEQRVRFVQDWVAIAKNMKALLQHLMNEHILDASEDQKNAFTIRSGLGKKRLKINIEELNEFASAGNRIAELEARALLIVAGDRNTARRALEDAEGEGSVEDKIPEFEVHTIGTTMNAQERTKMLAEYFDQFQKPQEPITIEAKVETPEDQS